MLLLLVFWGIRVPFIFVFWGALGAVVVQFLVPISYTQAESTSQLTGGNALCCRMIACNALC
eukprot:2141629-Amphidinium_carterae.1